MGNGEHKVNYDLNHTLKNIETGIVKGAGFLARKIDNVIQNRKHKKIEEKKPKVFKPNPNGNYTFNGYYNPSLLDLISYYEAKDIVGETSVSILSTLAIGGGHSTIVQGPSGSGKSLIQEAMLELIPEEMVYKLGLTTKAALTRDSEAINNAKAIYLGEFQKAMGEKDLREIFKDLSNGDSFRRIITSPSGKVTKLEIEAGKSVHTALAEENSFKNIFDNQKEACRRFIHLYTRINGDVTKEVLAMKAKKDSNPFEYNRSKSVDNIDLLSNHVAAMMDVPKLKYINPFAEYIAENTPVEHEMIAAFIDHYRNLVKDHALYHLPQRIILKQDDEQYAFCNFEDVKNVNDLYMDHFQKSIEQTSAEFKSNDNFNWDACFNSGLKIMKERYPNVLEPWLKNQIKTYVAYSLDPLESISAKLNSYEVTE